jgi:ankyrin repeat protein
MTPADRSVALTTAVAREDADGLLRVLRNDSGHFRYPEAATALLYSVLNESFPLVRLLLSAGVDVNATTQDGGGALMAAASRGNVELVTLLLENGADLSARNDIGQDAMMVAAKNAKREVVALFLTRGARQTKDHEGRTALHWGVMDHDSPECIKLLCSSGWDPKVATTERHLSPIDYAKQMKRPLALAVLLNALPG